MIPKKVKSRAVMAIIFLMVFVVLLAVLFAPSSSSPAKAGTGEAAWWDYSWSYRKQHTINSAAGAGTNYQIKIIVHYGAGTDSGADVYLNSHSRTDFADIRFVDPISTPVALDYWMESKVDGDNAVFWVEVAADLSTISEPVDIYYGNASAATSTSDGSNTFLFFDDFSGDLSKWTVESSTGAYPQIESGYLRAGGGVSSGSPYGFTSLGSSPSYSAFVDNAVGGKIRNGTNGIGEIAFRGTKTGDIGYKGRIDQRSGQGQSFLKPPYTVGVWQTITGCTNDAQPPTADTWNNFEITASGSTFKLYRNGTLYRTCTDSQYSAAGEIALQNHYGDHTDYDDVYVRKFVATEPAHSTWSLEEPKPLVNIYRSVGPNATSDLNSSGRTVTISGTTATFSGTMPDNIGVGDVLKYGANLAFISRRTSSTVYTVQDVNGGTPASATDSAVNVYRAYTSLANAESGIENTSIGANFDDWTAGGDATTDDVGKDLVTAKQQWNIALYANGTTADTIRVTISGWTTGISNYIRIYTPTSTNEVGVTQRHAGKWDDNKYKLGNNSLTGVILGILGDYTIVEGVQIEGSSGDGSTQGINVGASSVRIFSSIIRNAYGGIFSGTDNKSAYIFNNIIYNAGHNGIYLTSWSTNYLYNNTIYGCPTGILKNGFSSHYLKNNIVQNSTTGYSGSFDSSSTNNISDHADSPGLNPINSVSIIFVDATNKDFHLASNDNTAKDAGADLHADANLAFTTDIDGQTRTGSWDIGADEYVVTIPGAPAIGTATAGDTTASVAFTPPVSDGGSTITGYTATSSPGGFTGTGAESPITVSGLSNGTAYTFTVHATNSVGNSTESAASNSVTPASAEATKIYRSASPGATSDLNTSAQTVTISGTTATFSDVIPDNIGVGDVLQYQVTGTYYLAFISGRTSSTVYTVQSSTGGTPQAATAGTAVNVYRAYTSLSNAEAGIENTGINSTVRNFDDWTAGGDAAADDVGKDLVVANQQWNIALYANGITADTTGLYIGDWTTGTDNGLKIYTPYLSNEVGISQRHQGKWDNGKYQLVFSASSAIGIETSNVRFEGIQVKGSAIYNPIYKYGGVAVTNVIFDSSLIYADGAGPYINTGDFVFSNSILLSKNGYVIQIHGTALGRLDNCTLIGDGTTGIYAGWGTKSARNSYFGNGPAVSGGSATLVSSAGSDSTARTGYTPNVAYSSTIGAKFSSVTPGSEDFHLQTGSSLINSGTDLSASFLTDIDGHTRPTLAGTSWDIGADEAAASIYRSIAPGALGDLNNSSFTVAISGDTATFASGLPNNVGVGDVIQYQVSGTYYLAFISSRVSSTVYKVQSASGGLPQAAAAGTANKIYRAYTSLYNAERGVENTAFDASVRNFDDWTAGGDATTDDVGKDLVAANQQWNIAAYPSGTTVDSSGVTVDGWVTGVSNYIRVYTPFLITEVGISQRHSGVWDQSKYQLVVNSDYTRTLSVYADYFRVEGLQIAQIKTGPNSYGPVRFSSYRGTSSYFVLDSSIINSKGGVTTDTSGTAASLQGGIAIFRNLIVYGTSRNGIRVSYGYSSPNLTVENSTIGGFSQYGIVAENPSYISVKNTYAGGNGVSDYSNVTNITSSASSDAVVRTGVTASVANSTANFVNVTPGNEDYHLASGSALKDGGLDLSTLFTTDIDGAPRSGLWDIGADEAATAIYRSVAPSMTSNLNTSARTVTISGATATFSAAMPDNVGVGDVLQYNPGSGLTLAFISGRVSSTSYTLQSSSGGAPTAASTGTAVSVFRAYTSLANAEAGIENTAIDSSVRNFDIWSDRDLVSNNEQWNITLYANGTTAESGYVNLTGWTTNPYNYLRVYTPSFLTEVGVSQRNTGVWDDGKYKFTATNDNNAVNVTTPYTRIEGLQIAPLAGRHGILLTGNGITAASNIIKGTGGTAIGTGIGMAWGNLGYIYNNIIYDMRGIGGSGISVYSNYVYYVYNNTVYNCTTGIRASDTTKKVFKNNLSVGNTTDYNLGSSWDPSSTNNLSDDLTSPNASFQNLTVSFVDAVTRNLHISSTDTAAKDTGIDLSADANLAFTTDIDGATRTGSWDIGADEAATAIYRSVAPSMTSDLNTSARTVTISGTTATFSAAMPDNIGVGDVLQYNPGSGLTLAFISGRVSSTSYTLQSSLGGTPTEAPAGTAVSVFRAYTSLSNAESGIENAGIDTTLRNFDDWTAGGDATTDDVGKDLFASNQQWNIALYANGTTADTSFVDIDGWTTSMNNHLKIFTPTSASEVGISQRHAGVWNTDKYHLQVSRSYTAVIRIYSRFVKLDGLQVYATASDRPEGINSGPITSSFDKSNQVYISNNIVRGSDPNSDAWGIVTIYGINAGNDWNNSFVWNNIVYDFTTITAGSGQGIIGGSYGGKQYIYNNTVYHNNVGIVSYYPGNSLTAKNNLSAGNVEADYYIINQTPTISHSNNLSSDETSWDSAYANKVVSFVDPANRNLHITSTDTAAKDAGVDLTADANFAFSTDIDGQTRSGSWDIGADEYVQVQSEPTFTQASFRWYQNNDAVDPFTSYASENTSYLHNSPATPIRLRLAVQVGGGDLAAGSQAFALQWSSSQTAGWKNLGAAGATFGIRAKNNATPADGATIGSLMLTGSNVKGSYAEAAVTAVNPNTATIGQRIEYDFALDPSLTAWGETYYFRLTKSDGNVFASYAYYPQLTIGAVIIRGGNTSSYIPVDNGVSGGGTGTTGGGAGASGATGGSVKSDSFTGADGTPLATHDSNWVSMDATRVVTNLAIYSNQVRGTAWAPAGAMHQSSSSDISQITLKPFANSNLLKRACVRAGLGGGADRSGYCAYFTDSAGGNWNGVLLSKNGDYLSGFSKTFGQATDHILKITVSGTASVTITAYLDGTSVGTYTDNTSPLGTGGHPGFMVNIDSDFSTSAFDDWTDGGTDSGASGGGTGTTGGGASAGGAGAASP